MADGKGAKAMGEADGSVLRRKLRASQPAPTLSAMTPQKAMRLAVARAAEQALACAASVPEMAESRGAADEIGAALPDLALVLRLDRPDGARGLALLCPQVVGAVIEAQTIGRVTTAKAADRAPTRTDAIMVTDFLDLVLTGFAALATGCVPPPPVSGYVSAGSVADLRGALMALSDVEHVHYAVALEFADGAKAGTLHLLLPGDTGEASAEAGPAGWDRKLGIAVLGSCARLEAVLCRERLPLSRVTGLAVGDVLRLNAASLDRVAVCGPGGRTLLTARLGRSGAVRALRLVLDSDVPTRIAQGAAGLDAAE